MSNYISLYRKYRPLTFEEVVGQEHIVQTLKNAVNFKRISHAYLFAGLKGSGKTTVARIFAKALNCVNGPTASPCGKCEMCSKIANSQAADVLEIDAASNRGIDEIRALQEGINFVPLEARWKVYIIDEVHMLTDFAFNALLKTLEEPPANTVFILATTQPEKVPPTIISRVQQFDFRRISEKDIKATLEKINQSEKISIEEAALNFIAREAKGSLRDAISFLDELVSYKKNDLTLADARFLMGTVSDEFLDEILAAIIKKDYPALFGLIDRALEQGKNFTQILNALTDYFRLLLLLKVEDKGQLPVSAERKKILEEKFGFLPVEFFKEALQKFSATFMELRWHPYPELHLELALLDISEILKNQQPVELPAEPENEEKNQATPAGENPKSPLENLEFMKVKQHWSEFLEKLKAKSYATYILVSEGNLTEVLNKKIILKFKKGLSFYREKLRENSTQTLIDSILKEIFGEEVRLEAVLEDLAAHSEEKKEPAPKTIQLNSPAAKLAQLFGGRVVKNSENQENVI